MDFNQLMQKMRELDQPAQEGNEFSGALAKAKEAGQDEFEVDGKKYQVKEDGTVEECPMGMPSPTMPPKDDTPPPSMSVNLNAQGLDDISELMKLMTKVNPDMINQPEMPPLPSLSAEPSIMSIKPDNGFDGPGPLKMLPDLDADNNDMPGGEMDIDVKGLDKDSDGDNDMEKKGKDEAFGNSLNGSEPDYKGLDAAIPDGDDLNRPKKSFSGKPYRGDNPMAASAYESTDLRAQIRAELLQRLEEAKKK